jgi:hypothetical protein
MSSWEAYCAAEFGISRAQAYRLPTVARALGAIHDAVAADTPTSRTRDTAPAATAALDYGLSQRALIAVSGVLGEPEGDESGLAGQFGVCAGMMVGHLRVGPVLHQLFDDGPCGGELLQGPVDQPFKIIPWRLLGSPVPNPE